MRVKNALADQVGSPLKLGLAGLRIAHDDAGIERLRLDDLHAALEEADLPVKMGALKKAVAASGNRVTRKKVGGHVLYRLTIPGRALADEVLGTGDLDLVYVDGTTPRTDRRALGDVLGDLKGTIRVCDPYYGVRTLDSLELLPKASDVHFLTARTNESPTKWSDGLKDFKKERPNVKIRLAANPTDLHDRYVLSDAKILIVGHGLKDIGGKESFIIVLPRTLAADLLGDVERSFDAKWSQATPV